MCSMGPERTELAMPAVAPERKYWGDVRGVLGSGRWEAKWRRAAWKAENWMETCEEGGKRGCEGWWVVGGG